MQKSLRPCASAGVVLAGAGLIAMTPMAGPSLDVQSRAVQLLSTGSPLEFADLVNPGGVSDQAFPITTPAELASNTATNLQDLQNQIAADPAPILEQLIANQATYSNDLATAAENASSDFTSAVQGLPDVFAQTSADFASGDVYDGLTVPSSYLLTSALEVNHDLLNGTSEVAQGMTNSLDRLVNDTGEQLSSYFTTSGDQAVPTWLSDLIVAPLYGPNAELAGFAGVSQDIVTAADNGDYTTVLSDLANAPSTLTDAFLNGYDVQTLAPPPPPTAEVVDPDAAMRLLGLNPEIGFLTGAADPVRFDLAGPGLVERGTIENIYEASLRIAHDLGPQESAKVVDIANGPLAELSGSASGAAGLADTSPFLTELSTALSPLLSDLTGLFDGSAATDIGSQLTTDFSALLLGLL
jgi:hypothetical protein